MRIKLTLLLAIIGLFAISIGIIKVYSEEIKSPESDGMLGPLMVGENVCQGHPDGLMKLYDDQNELTAEVPCRSGKNEGIVKTYDPGGILHSEISYKEGKINGKYKMYYESGAIMEDNDYKDNLLNGISKRYSPDGKLAIEEKFSNGMKIGGGPIN